MLMQLHSWNTPDSVRAGRRAGGRAGGQAGRQAGRLAGWLAGWLLYLLCQVAAALLGLAIQLHNLRIESLAFGSGTLKFVDTTRGARPVEARLNACSRLLHLGVVTGHLHHWLLNGP